MQISNWYLFTNRTAEIEDEIHPVTIREIDEAHQAHNHYSKYFRSSKRAFKDKNRHISARVISNTVVLVYKESRLVSPTQDLQSRVIQWYHHYLMHPRETRMYATLAAVMFWKNMQTQIFKYVKTCERCQLGKKHKLKYGHIPPKIATIVPW